MRIVYKMPSRYRSRSSSRRRPRRTRSTSRRRTRSTSRRRTRSRSSSVPSQYRSISMNRVMFVVDHIVGGDIGFLPSGSRGGRLLLAYYIYQREGISASDAIYLSNRYWSDLSSSQRGRWTYIAELVNEEAEMILRRHGY